MWYTGGQHKLTWGYPLGLEIRKDKAKGISAPASKLATNGTAMKVGRGSLR